MRRLVLSIVLMSVLLPSAVVLGFAPPNAVDAQPCKEGETNKQCINGERRVRNIHNIDQLNEAIAQQNGGDVAQNQLNSATLEGDHFNIHQKNKAVSEGADSSFQNQLNNVDIVGDHNNIHQTNKAKSDADNSVILQANQANAEGDHNNIKQKNQAQQTGSGSQVLSQSNSAGNDGDENNNNGNGNNEGNTDNEPEGGENDE